MKRILPVEELARDERFHRINIEELVETAAEAFREAVASYGGSGS